MSRYNPLLDDEHLFGRRIEDFDYVERVDKQTEKKTGEKVLVVAVGREIFAIDGKKIKKIAERKRWIRALCYHNGKLYDGGEYEAVYETLSNRKVAKRDGWVTALCSHNGNLYDGGRYGAIYETLGNEIIVERDSAVMALCSYKGKLYDGGDYGVVYETLGNEIIAERNSSIWALCPHNRRLYDGCYEAIYETLNNRKVAKRNGWVLALCSHNGKLYDSGNYRGVYETLTGKLFRRFDSPVNAMVSVDREVVGL